MKPTALVLLSGLLAVSGAVSQTTQPPNLEGYVTRVASSSDFDVNGFRVVCGPETQSALHTGRNESLNNAGCPQETPYVGEAASIYGSLKKKRLSVKATEIDLLRPALPADEEGSAVIVAVSRHNPASQDPGAILVQADGYRILIDKKTEVRWASLIDALDDVRPGDWIQYKGRLDNAGLLTASSAGFSRTYITNRELKLRGKEEYNPASVPQDARQSKIEEAFGVYDPKRFPPFKNPAMQARIERIGNSLIPAYQKALSGSAPAKIHFRFQLVDAKSVGDAMTMTLPNGVILVPRQVVERMQNDSQLAAVLADNLAYALERIEYRYGPVLSAASASVLASHSAVYFLPVMDLPAIAAVTTAQEVHRKMEHQAERVSLGLLHDAGYQVDEAPRAWWLLATKKQKTLADAVLPEPTAYLYRILGETWNNPAPALSRSH